eukprot:TRINITY_DN4351_c0_g2_i1.p1 TRINITY_DN4351_c0_g2~~TRINITY_DN4351_c0_g2_i1.p1  ORF type:complete len:307 (+),score=45.22 TRINITY_DN4351_c0_g2_i1:56-976(+)
MSHMLPPRACGGGVAVCSVGSPVSLPLRRVGTPTAAIGGSPSSAAVGFGQPVYQVPSGYSPTARMTTVSNVQLPAAALALAPRSPTHIGTVLQSPVAATAVGNARSGGIILCVGDSLTAGTYRNRAYPHHLERLLHGHNSRNFTVRNVGVHGYTCDQMSDELTSALRRITCEGSQLALVLILGGTNDIIRGSSAAVILEKLRRLHDQATRAPGSPLVASLTLPPAPALSQEMQRRIQEVNEGLRRSCPPGGCSRIFVDLEAVRRELSNDGLHYEGRGYEEFAAITFRTLQPFLSVSVGSYPVLGRC